jgi:predicted O-linked N-acetylglucosamine transferase (SPINDLY family)
MQEALRKAIQAQKQGRLQDAVAALEPLFKAGMAGDAECFFLGLLWEASGALDRAGDALRRAVELNPDDPEYWFSLGNVEQAGGAFGQAVQAFLRCVERDASHAKGWVNLALAAQQLDAFALAIEASAKAVSLAPGEVKAWLTCIGSLGFARRFEEARQVACHALSVFPDEVALFHMLGNVEVASGNPEQGFRHYLRGYELAPEAPPLALLNSIGLYHSQHGDAWDALAFHQRVLSADPKNADAWHGLAAAQMRAGYPRQALEALLQAFHCGCRKPDAWDALLLAIQYLDDRDEAEVFDMHCCWEQSVARALAPARPPLPDVAAWEGKRPFRIALVSADLHEHSVARFVSCLLRHAATSEVELHCFSDARPDHPQARRLQALGGVWHACSGLTDEALAVKVAKEEVDVLVDLAGHTGKNRLLTFARQPVAVQVSWLGYPNTTGLKTFSARISDAYADPPGQSDLRSTEPILRLKNGFHAFEPPVALPDVQEAPCFKNGFLTFGSFNNLPKLTPLTVRRWALLLEALPQSRLLLKHQQNRDVRNRDLLMQKMAEAGVDVRRVVFVPYCESLEDHYAVYHQVDIALDSFPYNGTTTTCEALWMGIPVLTIEGQTQRSRTAGSLLFHAGLADWICADEHEWVSKVLAWDASRAALNDLRMGLRAKVTSSPIGDGAAFCRKWVAALRDLHAERCSSIK